MKIFLSTLLAVVIVMPAFAEAREESGFIVPLGVVVSYGSDSGRYHKAGKIGCDNPDNCVPYSIWAISADMISAFSFLHSGNKGLSFGPWIGQDVGRMSIGDAGSMFGITNIGGALYMNFADTVQWYLTAGYGFAYADIDNANYKMNSNFSTGFASMTGVSFSPFRGTWFAPIGFNYNFKFTSYLPDVYGQTPDTAGKYSFSVFSSFGFFVKF